MSLLSVAQGESSYLLACNFETSSTEKTNAAGFNVSSTAYGTITQTNSSLTGDYSYIFGSNGNVLHQWGGSYSVANVIHEIVFKRSSAPSSEVGLMSSPGGTIYDDTFQILLTSSGYIRGYARSSYGSTSSITGTTNLCDGKFHHVVWAYNNASGNNARLYVDGVLVGSTTTIGNIGGGAAVSIGASLGNSGTYSGYSAATIDFAAYYKPGTALTATQMDTFVANHMAAFANKTVTSTALTASALAVQPTLTIDSGYAPTAVTASAAMGNVQVSNFNTPTMLDGYLAGRSLEQWWKFDEIGKIHNYGSGGDAESAWSFGGAAVNVPQGGIQGSGALKLKGEQNNQVVLAFGVNEPYSTEITDNEFSIGFWFKAESGFGAQEYFILNAQELFSNNNYLISVSAEGYIRFQMNHGGTSKTVSTVSNSNYNWCDGNWHFVQARRSTSNSTIKLTVDNGTEISTSTGGIGNPAVGYMSFGMVNGTGTNNKYGYLSHMFITGYDSIGSTERAAIITAAAVPIQATAGMVKPVVRFENAYNDLLATYSPKIAFRLNEASGAPINYGNSGTLSVGKNGSNITYKQPTQNTYAYKFTNADTYIQGDYSYASGTFSSGNHQTVSAIFKAESTVNFEQIIASMGMYGFLGCGITLSIGATNGYLEARINQGFGGTDTDALTTTINVADNKWHHAVGVRDGSSFKLYLDGKQVATMSSAGTNLSDAATYGISAEGKFNFGQGSATKALYIDEVAVLSTSLSASQVFGLYQSLGNATEWTASAALPSPAVAGGFGPIITATALTATAKMCPVFPPIAPANAQALFQNPNYEARKNVSNSSTALTASATFADVTFQIGEYNGAEHMDASASFPNPRVLLPGIWNASPAIANANIVQPAFSSTKGARINAQSLPVSAIFVTPPAYKLITDDIWYQKLYLQHSEVHGEKGYTAGVSSAYAFLKLFDDVTASLGGAVTNKLTNNLPWSIVIDNPDTTQTTTTYATASNGFLTATPTPVLEVGTFDDYERKAVRFRNIQFKIAEDTYKADGTYSLEFTFKTTKANQVIAQGYQQSFYGNQQATSSIGLIDGKLFASRATQPIGGTRIFAHPDNKNLGTINTAYGNRAIADGAWHHVIIQYGFDGRVQFWIDGQLDIQFFADSQYGRGAQLRPYILGSNNSNPRWQSDFETSAWSYDAAHFVDSGDITEHYTASIKYDPIKAPAATATAELGQDSKAEGNRPRALMLYFWPTSTAQQPLFGPKPNELYTSDESPNELETLDWYTKPPQDYHGWDVFPVDVTGRYVSDLVKPEAYGVENISLTNFSSNIDAFSSLSRDKVKVNKRGTFRDTLTDAPRYIDLINDIDLSKFDLIIFKNYPNDPSEKDAFSTNEVVDAYFNLRESVIFEQFLKSLRAAVDTGLSLYVTNSQLALDLKIVDRVETVPDMYDLSGYESDPYAPTQVPQGATLPVSAGAPAVNIWEDTWRNNRVRVVNTQPGLTDNGGLIKTQIAFWQNDDNAVRYGGPDRPFDRYEHKNSLAVGDEFLISNHSYKQKPTSRFMQSAPIANVKAGKVITAFANTVRRGLESITNPYRNHALAIAVNPGDVLDGRQVGGKIFVNFTENINYSYETGDVDLRSDYWINYAYDNGAITADQRDAYLAATWNTDTTPYWSSDGMNILMQATEIQDENLQKKGVQTSPAKVRTVNKNGGISFKSVASGTQYFALTYSWQYPRATFEVPSIFTNGFRWLSNREVLEGTVIRPEAFNATAEMANALGVPDRVNNFRAQSMVATALIEETRFSSGARIIPVLPAIATATIVKPGSTIGVPPMTANAIMRLDSKASVAAEDQVTVYLIHVDPILYIREDVIK